MASTCAFADGVALRGTSFVLDVDADAKGDDHGNHTDRKLQRRSGLRKRPIAGNILGRCAERVRPTSAKDKGALVRRTSRYEQGQSLSL